MAGNDDDLNNAPHEVSLDDISADDVQVSLADKVFYQQAGDEAREDHLLDQDVKDREQDRGERKAYANKIYKLIVGWMLGLALVVGFCSFHHGWFRMSDQVMMVLLSTTTVKVVGLMYIVATYLFPKRQRP